MTILKGIIESVGMQVRDISIVNMRSKIFRNTICLLALFSSVILGVSGGGHVSHYVIVMSVVYLSIFFTICIFGTFGRFSSTYKSRVPVLMGICFLVGGVLGHVLR